MHRPILTATIIAALSATLASSASARDKAPADVVFPDGAIGSVTAECGLGDLCASLVLPNKDVIELYNLGAGYCQAYTLNMVRKRGDAVMFQSPLQSASKRVKEGIEHFDCDQFVSTYYTFDIGRRSSAYSFPMTVLSSANGRRRALIRRRSSDFEVQR